MALLANHFTMSAMLIMGLLITVSLDFTVANIGVAYGINGKHLLPPAQVVDLYKKYSIHRMRIYEPFTEILDALKGSDIELTMSILNPQLSDIAASQDNAHAWVQEHVINYIQDVKISNIVVGNEISPTSENTEFVLQAMKNVDAAISEAGLGDNVKITTSIAADLLAISDPPEDGVFKPENVPYLMPIIQFAVNKGAPLLASIYPYFAYRNDPEHIKLPYALLDPTFPGYVTRYGKTYQNLFDAMYDAFYAAIEKIVVASPELSDANTAKIELWGGESGWPTDGGPPKTASVDQASSVENAKTYINNLIQVVKKGTPQRPDHLDRVTFIFAMFDENLKLGDETEKHFGLFLPDGTAKYQVNFN